MIVFKFQKSSMLNKVEALQQELVLDQWPSHVNLNLNLG